MLAAPIFQIQIPRMPKKIITFPAAPKQKIKRSKAEKPAPPQLGREAVFSFLKDTRGMISWTARDLAETLNVTLAEANIALPILEMQRSEEHTSELQSPVHLVCRLLLE